MVAPRGNGDGIAMKRAWPHIAVCLLVIMLGVGLQQLIGAEGREVDHDIAQPLSRLSQDDVGVKIANLKDQLEKGLRVRRPLEFAYVDYIHGLVQTGDLPVQLVLETFHWSRRQDPHVPFPYFQRAIRLRAARAGITIQ